MTEACSLVVLTARLCLPGRAELGKLGRFGCVWRGAVRLVVSSSVTMSTFALIKVAGSSAPGLYMAVIKELFRKPGADGEADNDIASVSVDVKLEDKEFAMTLETPALFVLGGPIKPTDDEVKAFLTLHSPEAAGLLTLPVEATLEKAQKVQDLDLLQLQANPVRTLDVRKTSSQAAVTSETRRQREKRQRRRSASVGSVSDRDISDTDSDIDKHRLRARSVQVLCLSRHSSVY